ncbi:MAG: C39 family peptidase [Leptospiraceae bacterium]|nr:C39 family peptidase [Leptospiraceae bacterium]MCP5497492.1 C39 family peptidase [Leptospiraceae bacterium]
MRKLLNNFLLIVFLFHSFCQGAIPQSQPSTGSDYNEVQSNYYVAGIPSKEFEYYTTPSQSGRQRQANWCWAACIQMVLNYHGLFVTQEQVVERIYGGLVDSPAGVQEIMNALSGWAANNRGGYSRIYAQYGLWSTTELVKLLSNKKPLIVGLTNPNEPIGHTYVITAVYYTMGALNIPNIHKVILRDPMPTKPSRQEMSWNEFISRDPKFFKIWVND